MAIGSSQWMYNSGDYEIEQSLRFDDGSGSYLSRTPSVAGNRKTWTYSIWVKRGNLGIYGKLFHEYSGQTARSELAFDTSDFLRFNFGGDVETALKPTQVFRDTSAWYHIVWSVDTTQSTASDRANAYINGVKITDFSEENYPALNAESGINLASQHEISGKDGASQFIDGYLAEINFIDGQALTPSSFGTTGNYGEWKPLEYKGTYGTNGFYLPFKQDYTVEGFSTVTWKGNSASSAYIGGVGFQPDLTWIKGRSLATSHHVVNSVSGASTRLQSNDPRVEAFQAENGYVGSFNTDGFTVAQGSSTHSTYTGWYETNQSGQTYVAWNWDMGNSYGLPHTITASGATNHSTAQQKFGTSSILFDGTTDKLTAASHADFNLLEKDFTFDMWVNFDVISNFQIVDIKGYADGLSFRMQEPGGSGKIGCYIANNNHTWNWVPSTGTWYHLALVRYGDSLKCYVDGSALTATAGGNVGGQSIAQGALQIGQELTGGTGIDFDGYIDDWRFSNIARYTGNFTVPSTTNTNDSNTILLIQSNTTNGSTTFVDSSGAAVNTSGTITSNVSANPTYGQSIVSYTGTSSAATVGHGLASAPQLIIHKNRDRVDDWSTWHEALGTGNKLFFNTTNATLSTSNYPTLPTSSLFYIGAGVEVNASSEAIIAYCFHSVAGYSKIGSYEGNGIADGPEITTGFRPAFVLTKNADAADDWSIADSARSPEIDVSTGKSLRPNSTSAEDSAADIEFTSTGFKITQADSHRINYNNETFIYMAFADTREYAYWLDQSGNNNDWTSNSLTESDIMVDSPTNNFATMNPNASGSATEPGTNTYTTKEGNLESKWTGIASAKTYATIAPTDGKWYWEFFIKTQAETSRAYVGLCEFEDCDINGTGQSGDSNYHIAVGNHSRLQAYGNEFDNVYTAPSQYDVYSIAIDWSASPSKFWFRINGGAWQGGGNPATGATPTKSYNKTIANASMMPYHGSGSGSASNVSEIVFNFGSDSSFAGNKTAQGNQDANGIGDFYYAPPAGFLALCTQNLPDATVIPSENFNTVLYTNTTAVTGVGFAPDLVWHKSRNQAYVHYLYDIIRGTGAKGLNSNTTSVEGANDSLGIVSFDSDGVTYSSDAGLSQTQAVGWFWKANGTGVSNTDGTITSTVSANVDAGFSIVSYTGTGANATVGHGLSVAPELVIAKQRNSGQSWPVYHVDNGSGNVVYLDLTNASASSTAWQSTTPTSTLVSVGTSSATNGNGNTYIAYAFHSVDGYSKVGSYTGNGNADGTFVHCGFKPAFVLIKRSDSAGDDWHMMDTTRSSYNVMTHRLKANATDAESSTDTSMDALSNGFKLRNTSGARNNGSGTYIFLAFAETPFKHSNAR